MIAGNNGDDQIFVSGGADTMTGGDGQDTFWVDGTDAPDLINIVEAGNGVRVEVRDPATLALRTNGLLAAVQPIRVDRQR